MDFIDRIWQMKIINSVVVVIITFVLYKGVIFVLNKSEGTLFTNKKGKTYFKLIKNVIRFIFMIIAVLVVLQTNGIDVSSVLAGVGIIGVVFGLAIQDWLKDIIRGSSILSDEYFQVGDIIKYKDIEGRVLVIGLKTTKIQDLKNNNIISIANRNIEEVQLVSNLVYLSIPMPYETNIKIAENTVYDICEAVKSNNNVNDCIYKGVNELAESCIKYYIMIDCNPINKLQVIRDANRSILVEMDRNGIKVPYNQIDVNMK